MKERLHTKNKMFTFNRLKNEIHINCDVASDYIDSDHINKVKTYFSKAAKVKKSKIKYVGF